jgi:hypothetical protein
VHRREQVVAVVEVQVGDVLPAVVGVAGAGGDDAARLAPDQMIDDRQVVRRQVPNDIHVVLEDAEVDAHRVDEQDVADFAFVDEVGHFPYRRAVDEHVIDEQQTADLCGHCDQLFGLGDRGRQRFLDEHMLAAVEGGFRQGEMSPDRGGDDDGVDLVVGEDILDVRGGGCGGILVADCSEAIRPGITKPGQMRVRARVQVADQVWSPISQPDYSNGNHCGCPASPLLKFVWVARQRVKSTLTDPSDQSDPSDFDSLPNTTSSHGSSGLRRHSRRLPPSWASSLVVA